MFMNGADYKLARKLKSIVDHQVEQLPAEDRLQIIRDKIKTNIHDACEKSAKDIMSAPESHVSYLVSKYSEGTKR